MSAFQGAAPGLLVGKQEGTAGTFETIAAADMVHRFYNVDIQPDLGLDTAGMEYANGGNGRGAAYPTTRIVNLTFDMDFIPAATDAAEPGLFNVCNAGGLGNAAVGSTGRIMRLRKAYATQPWSFVYFLTELGEASPISSRIAIAGAMGNVVFKGTMNQVLKASFSLKGKLILASTVDATILAATSATNTKPAQAFTDSTFTIATVAEKVSEWQLDLGNEVSPIWDSSDPSGISHFAITKSAPKFSCNPLGKKFATKNWLSTIATWPTYSANQPLYGGVQIETPAAGRFSCKMMDAQPMNPKLAAREGFKSWGLDMELLANGAPGALIDSVQTLEDTFYWLQGTMS
jgi:hypothetical protein